jgi:hypothetical protein
LTVILNEVKNPTVKNQNAKVKSQNCNLKLKMGLLRRFTPRNDGAGFLPSYRGVTSVFLFWILDLIWHFNPEILRSTSFRSE